MKKFVLLFAALLVAGCGEKSLSDSAISKALEEAVERSSLQKRDGVYYQPKESKPYSGWVKMLYDSGQPEALARIKDGKRDGLHVGWHRNGKKKYEENNKKGERHGLYVDWHENGQKAHEATYKDGGLYGLATVWYENGKKEAEGIYKDDQLNGLAAGWHENGQKWREETLEEGKIISEKYWNSKGEEVATREESEK